MLKDFNTLWKFYPMWNVCDTTFNVFFLSEKTPNDTKSWVLVNVKNACVIRVCYALNCSVSPIRPVKIGAKYLTGCNGYFLIKVTDMRQYLTKRYGEPNVVTLEKGKKAKEILKGKKGIIIFLIDGWGNATGHCDLWNGSIVKWSDYFNHPNLQKVLLWEVSN